MLTNRQWKISLLTGLLALLTVSATFTQQMNYQGRLTDSSGTAVADAQYSITFDIYDAATGGTQLWGSQVIPADTVQGRFNVVIGPTDPSSRNIINAFNGGVPRYLQITYAGNPILPRQQILAAPVAFRAMIADTVTNGAIGTAQIADGSITAAKINGGTGVWVGNGANIYHDAGNIGVGTTAPNLKLQVNGVVGSRGLTTTDGYIDLQPGSSGNAGYLELIKPNNTRIGYMGYSGGGVGNWNLNLEGGAAFMINGGNVGIGLGTTAPAAALDVAGNVNVSGTLNAGSGVTTGSGASALPGHAPLIIEEKSPNNQTTWNTHSVDLSPWADRPGGFKIRIYAQHEQAAGDYEVRNYEATVVFEQPGYANNSNYTNGSGVFRTSFAWTGNVARQSMKFGTVNASGGGIQELFPDGWVKLSNYVPNSVDGGSSSYSYYYPPTKVITFTFHPAVSGRIVISDN